jgi:hypothetical protein
MNWWLSEILIDTDINVVCCFVWVCNSIADIEGGMKTEGLCE